MNASMTIEGELTVFTAHEIKTRLLGVIPTRSTLELQLGEVTEFDGAGLQLLLAAKHEAAQRESQLVLISTPAQVKAALQLTGLLDHFEATDAGSREVTP
jgi:anti-sigma B factor antagonist